MMEGFFFYSRKLAIYMKRNMLERVIIGGIGSKKDSPNLELSLIY